MLTHSLHTNINPIIIPHYGKLSAHPWKNIYKPPLLILSTVIEYKSLGTLIIAQEDTSEKENDPNKIMKAYFEPAWEVWELMNLLKLGSKEERGVKKLRRRDVVSKWTAPH